jgi:uncharacterized protein (DUF433 family)
MERSEKNAHVNLDQVLDQAIAQLQQGESIEACLARYPEYAAVLEPLLQISAELHAAADVTLPAEMEAWLATGAQEFAMLLEPDRIAQTSPAHAPGGGRAAYTADMATILDDAISRTRRGESIESVLAHYDRRAADLDPLLRTAAQVHALAATPLPSEMEAWLTTTGVHEFSALVEQATTGTARRRSVARTLTPQRITAAALIAAVMLGTIDTVSAQSLPGEPLYGWKRAKEDITVALTPDSETRSRLLVQYAQQRFIEVQTQNAKGAPSDQTLETLTTLALQVQAAIAEAKQSPNGASIRDEAQQILDAAQSLTDQVAAKDTAHAGAEQAPDTAKVLDETKAKLQEAEQQLATVPAAPTVSSIASNPTAVLPSATPTPLPGITSSGGLAPSATQTPSATTGASILGGVVSTPTAIATEPLLPSLPPTNTPVSPTPIPLEPSIVVPAAPAPTTTPVPTIPPAAPAEPTRVPATPEPTLAPLPTAAPAVPTDVPTSTPTPTATVPPEPSVPVEPPSLPTRTPRPPTATPTSTPVPPTATPTSTPVPPTATPTSTPVPPTATPTSTPVPPTATPTVTPTIEATALPTLTSTVTPTITSTVTPTTTTTVTPTISSGGTSLPDVTPTVPMPAVTTEPPKPTEGPAPTPVLTDVPPEATKVPVIALPTETIEAGGPLPPPLNPTLTTAPSTPIPTVVFAPIGTPVPSPAATQPTSQPTAVPAPTQGPTAQPAAQPSAQAPTQAPISQPAQGISLPIPPTAVKSLDEAGDDTQ